MPYNYSYNEIQRMKEDAVRRVQEMQKQSTIVSPQKKEVKPKTEAPKNVEKEVETPKVPIKTKNRQPTMHSATGLNIHGLPKKAMQLLNDEDFSEQALLLIVTLLLLNEKCDTALVLALLYILSE